MAGSSTPTADNPSLIRAPDWRRLPLAVPALLCVAGLTLTRTDLLPVWSAWMISVVAILALSGSGRWRLALILLAALVWGYGSLMLDAWRVSLDQSWLGEWKIEGRVIQAEHRATGYKLRLRDVVRSDGEALHGFADLYRYGHVPMPRVGQTVALEARFRQPDNDRNPGAFDYRAWCFDHHVALLGSVRGDIETRDADVPWIEQARQRIRLALSGIGHRQASVLQALLLADRSAISEAQYTLFSATGTAHLLAISGLHMGMAAGWAFALVWWLLTRRESWIVRFPVRRMALAAGVLAAIAYGTLAGWPLPAQRAGLMLAGAAVAWWLAARAEPLNTLFAALLLILLIDPAAVASLSLWLSFLATAALLLWGLPQSGRSGLKTAIRALVWISLLAWLVTLPLVVAAFGRLPLYGLPANLLLVPLYGFGVMPLSLSGELLAVFGWTGGAAWALSLAGTLIGFGQHVLAVIADWPGGITMATSPAGWVGALYACLLVLAGYGLWKGRRSLAATVTLMALAVFLFSSLHERHLSAPVWMVWDVGQGAASSLMMPDGGVLVIDVPGMPGSRFNGGTRVADGLRALGITHADVLVLSHAQSDHLGGAMSLMRRLNSIGELWLPDVPGMHHDPRAQAIERLAIRHGTRLRWLQSGDALAWHGTRVDVLWPPKGFAPENANNASLVLRLRLPSGQGLLMPADSEAPVEAMMPPRGKVDAMLVPHHGSRTSSTAAFVHALLPDIAIAQTGRGNRYHFPAAEVVDRYRALGTRFLNTADGAVMLAWPASGGQPDVRIWQAPVSGRRESALKWWQSLL